MLPQTECLPTFLTRLRFVWHSLTIHVWYIYLNLPLFLPKTSKCRYTYTIRGWHIYIYMYNIFSACFIGFFRRGKRWTWDPRPSSHGFTSRHWGLALPETNSDFTPENQWLGWINLFILLWESLFSGAFAVSFRECKFHWISNGILTRPWGGVCKNLCIGGVWNPASSTAELPVSWLCWMANSGQLVNVILDMIYQLVYKV